MKILVTQSSSGFCNFPPPPGKFSPQHPVLKNPVSTLFSLVWETKFHTHTKQVSFLEEKKKVGIKL
jgi:hypothetical protein